MISTRAQSPKIFFARRDDWDGSLVLIILLLLMGVIRIVDRERIYDFLFIVYSLFIHCSLFIVCLEVSRQIQIKFPAKTFCHV